MSDYTLADFNRIPAGGEALPPENGEYHRAIHLPSDRDDPHSWALVRGEGRHALVDWVDSQYLVVSGYTPADRLGMTFTGPRPDTETGEPLTVRIAVEYPLDEGVSAWAVAKALPDIVSDEDAFHRLMSMRDRSAAEFMTRLALGDE